MDKIFLNQMHFYGYHGVYKEEKKLGQAYLVDVELSCCLKKASKTDHVADTSSYEQIYHVVKEEVEGESVNLIETLADQIAKKLLTSFSFYEARVRVMKKSPPLPGSFQSVGVEIVRSLEGVDENKSEEKE